MIPKIDQDIGIQTYSTDIQGCGGIIKQEKKDFMVQEVLAKHILKSIMAKGKYSVYILKKNGIDTTHALEKIKNKTRQNLKALGLKDAQAVTQQYVCSTRANSDIQFESNNTNISKIGYVNKPLTKKDMIGNQFIIKINNSTSKIISLDNQDILNFYGYQRFGSKRPLNHLVGKAIIKGNFEQATDILLGGMSEYDSVQNNKIRKYLADKTISYDELPRGMDLERKILKELEQSGDHLKALRSISVSLRRFFVQSYQSYLFNQTLSKAYKDGEKFTPSQNDVCFDVNGNLTKYDGGIKNKLAIPFVGYSYYKKTRFHEIISEILQSEEIKPSDFFTKNIQEAGNEGGFREAIITYENFSISQDVVSFMLSRGSFATIVLREIMKPSDPLNSGF